MKIIAGIYKITSPSGKVYIGQSLNILNRWRAYKNYKAPKQPYLRNSFIKYGVSSHAFEVLIDCSINISQYSITYFEQYYIDYYRSKNVTLLNVREAGKNGRHSEATKEKFKELRKGRKASEATKIKMAELSKQRYLMLSEDKKEEIKGRLNKTGFNHSDETKRKLQLSHSGKTLPE
jgi:group I intron endonuclease